MSGIALFIQAYASFFKKEHREKAQTKIKEFEGFINSISKLGAAQPPRLKYAPYHTAFLLSTLAQTYPSENISFTLSIQLLNLLLRQGQSLRIRVPHSLFQSLSMVLKSRQQLLRSPSVISHIIWLIGRCIQLSQDRSVLLKNLSESQLLEYCLQCPQFEPSTERGLTLLLSYMSKRELIKNFFSLKLLVNLNKFIQKDSIRQMMFILRRIQVEEIRSSKEHVERVTLFCINYCNNQAIGLSQKLQHWKLLTSLAFINPSTIPHLPIQHILSHTLEQPQLTLSEQMLNRTHQVASNYINTHGQQNLYLEKASHNLLENPVARRIFIQFHQKMTTTQFIGLLEGNLSNIMSSKVSQRKECNKILKILICLKRTAIELGLEAFYGFKFGNITEQVLKAARKASLKSELLDLWEEISAKGQQSKTISDWDN